MTAKTVLLVDDSATMLMSLKSTLTISGFKVETAPDGVQAIAKIKSGTKPDLVITDPPRAGMHEKAVRFLLDLAAPRIVYVSCNPATQARDIQLLSEKYRVLKSQPVDMFPHTHHIENVALLELTETTTAIP